MPAGILERKVNLNEEIMFTIELNDSSTSPDSLIYTAALIYNFDVIKVISF